MKESTKIIKIISFLKVKCTYKIQITSSNMSSSVFNCLVSIDVGKLAKTKSV